jgi:hypothetical protein
MHIILSPFLVDHLFLILINLNPKPLRSLGQLPEPPVSLTDVSSRHCVSSSEIEITRSSRALCYLAERYSLKTEIHSCLGQPLQFE